MLASIRLAGRTLTRRGLEERKHGKEKRW